MAKQHRVLFALARISYPPLKANADLPSSFAKPGILSSKILSKYPLVCLWAERKDLFLPPHLILNQCSYFQISSLSSSPAIVTSFLSFRYSDSVQLNFQQVRFS